MSEIKFLDDEIYSIASGEVVKRRKNIVLPALLAAGGAALICFGKYSEDNVDLNSVISFCGATLLIVGAIMLSVRLFGGGGVPYWTAGRKVLGRKRYYYDPSLRGALCEALDEGDFAAIAAMPCRETSTIMLVVYGDTSGGAVAAQLLEYVPHNYVPATEPRYWRKDEYKAARMP